MKKSELTKEGILAVAVQCFSEKGYTATTMKDICDASGLSRGGLYRHFESTKAIFIHLLEKDLAADFKAVHDAINSQVPADHILSRYFEHEKCALLSPTNGLFFAVHEFAFSESEVRPYFEARLAKSVALIEKLMRYGQTTGAFRAFDPKTVAIHCIYFFDSLKTSASVLNMSEATLDGQIELLKEMIVCK